MTRSLTRASLIALAGALTVVLLFETLSISGGLKVGGLVGFLVGLLYLVPRSVARSCPRCGFDLENVARDDCPQCGLPSNRWALEPTHEDARGDCCVICGDEISSADLATGCPSCAAAMKQIGAEWSSEKNRCSDCHAEIEAAQDNRCSHCGAAFTRDTHADG